MAGLATAVRTPVIPFRPPVYRLGGSDYSGSPLSPGTSTTPPPSPCAGVQIPSTLLDRGSPAPRKNKRKLSEPRKRGGAEAGVKRLCPPDSPGGSAMSDSSCSDDGGEPGDGEVVVGVHHRRGQVQRRTCRRRDVDATFREACSERREYRKGDPDRDTADLTRSGRGGSNGFPPAAPLGHPFFPVAGIPGVPPSACFVPRVYLADPSRAAGYASSGPFPMLPIAGLPHPAFPPVDIENSREDRRAESTTAGHRFATQRDPRREDSPNNLSEDDSSNYFGGCGGRRPRKNYKNMTRERRVEANARERTRVHTISAAFEALRRAVPSYSYNQKLSKLAILKIACSYIMALVRLAGVDCSHMSEPSIPGSFADCVDLCTRTIQTEGRARRRH